MNLRHIILAVTLFILTLPLMAQAVSSNYVIVGNKTISGLKLPDEDSPVNYQKVKVIYKDSTHTYMPSEISEFGYKDGPVFKSASIELHGMLRTVFLKELLSDEISLLYYMDDVSRYYVLKKDKEYKVLDKLGSQGEKQVFRKDLAAWTSSNRKISKEADNVFYTKNSLLRYTDAYNENKWRPGTWTHFGFMASATTTTFIFPENPYLGTDEANFNMKGYTLCAFVDIPILTSDFSFQIRFDFTRTIEDIYGLIYKAGEIPLTLKYNIPLRVVKPFFGMGVGPKLISNNFAIDPSSEISDRLQFPFYYEAGLAIPIHKRIQALFGVRLSTSKSIGAFNSGLRILTTNIYGGISF